MEFIETTVESFSRFPHAIDKVYFGRPKKKYHCPICETSRRKLVLFYEREDLKKNLHSIFKLNTPVCGNCFEFEIYRELNNKFYKSDIY